jgi:hypothetical protein
MEVLKRLEAGKRQVDVGRPLSLATSSITTMTQNSEKIKTHSKCATAITATKLTRSRSNLLERLLSIWIEEQNQRHIPMTQLIIMEKARSIFSCVQEQRRIKNRDIWSQSWKS